MSPSHPRGLLDISIHPFIFLILLSKETWKSVSAVQKTPIKISKPRFNPRVFANGSCTFWLVGTELLLRGKPLRTNDSPPDVTLSLYRRTSLEYKYYEVGLQKKRARCLETISTIFPRPSASLSCQPLQGTLRGLLFIISVLNNASSPPSNKRLLLPIFN